MSEVEKFLAELPKDGEMFSDVKTEATDEKQQQAEAPAKSPTEPTPEEAEKPSQGGENTPTEEQLPFHKHPRWKALQEERRQDRERIEELQSKLEEVQKGSKREDEPSIPKWFSDVYGADPTLWTQYNTMETQRRAEIKQEIFGEMQAQQQAKEEQAKRWENWVSENVQALRDEGASFDENRLMDFVLKYRPIDEQGNIDIRKGYELYSQINQASQANPSMAARKQAAAGTMSSAREASPQVGTPIEKLRRKSMLDLANEGL